MSGFIIINKPTGITSHDVVDKMRRITGIRKIGHAGTLDPFATGVLIVAIGREATREISKFVKMDKEYIATLRLGATSDTYDRGGHIVGTRFIASVEAPRQGGAPQPNGAPAEGTRFIASVINQFIGKQKQIPPMYSAKKIGGKKLYELARKGIEVERKPAEIEVFDIELLKYEWPILKIKVKCGSGTYIRSLANDIGEKLGCGAYLEELKRTAVGEFSLDEAVGLEQLKRNDWENFLIQNLSK